MAGTTPRTVRLQDLTVDVSLSGVAQGDLLFRGASKWNNLAAGTSGYYLKSNGAGADPSWASVSVSPAGSSGQLQWNSSSSFAGAAYLNYATSGSILTITDGAITDVPLVVDGVTSQSGDLQQWKVNGTTKAKVNASGNATVNSTLYFEDANGYITRSAASNTLSFAPSGAAVIMTLTAAGLYAPSRIYSLLNTGTIDMTVGPRNRGGNTGTGGSITILGGTGSTSGTPSAGGASYLKGGDGGTNQNGGVAYVLGGAKNGSGTDGNVVICYTGSAAIGNLALFGAGSFGSGVNVLSIANATTAPSTDPTGGGVLYCQGGALKARSSGGQVSVLNEGFVALSDASTIATDASLGRNFSASSATDRTLGAPTNPVNGQKCIWRWTNTDGSSHTLTLTTGAGGFRFGTDITALTATAAGKADYIGAVYVTADDRWDVVSYVKGY